MSTNPELHPSRYGGDDVYETKKVAEHWHRADFYRGWLLITLEKYCSRYGKKDSYLQEARKIAAYSQFLLEFEEKLAESDSKEEAEAIAEQMLKIGAEEELLKQYPM